MIVTCRPQADARPEGLVRCQQIDSGRQTSGGDLVGSTPTRSCQAVPTMNCREADVGQVMRFNDGLQPRQEVFERGWSSGCRPSPR